MANMDPIAPVWCRFWGGSNTNVMEGYCKVPAVPYWGPQNKD